MKKEENKNDLLKKGFDWEDKLETLIFKMVKDDEDEDSLKYAVEILKEKLNNIF